MIRKIYPENPNPKEISRAVEILQQGGVIIYPTDTVYGMGCDINNRKAIERIAKIKGITPDDANFSIICTNLSNLSEYAKHVNNPSFKLMKRCLPGPFTFILPAGRNVPKLLADRKKTIGIRVPDNAIILEIVRELGSPVITTSVHDDDEIIEYTTDPELIHEKYEDLVDLVIDGGYGHNEPSTVIDCTGPEPVIIRQGIGVVEL
jgi:tRNA threonylcarbamoyl adenosine modification protein (Sua5/YciO/YrdC/YwlC family)